MRKEKKNIKQAGALCDYDTDLVSTVAVVIVGWPQTRFDFSVNAEFGCE